MNIIFLANFPHKLDGGLMGRFINIAMLMYLRGHDVEVIVSDFEHSSKKHRGVMDNKYPFKLTYIHEPGYPGNVSPQRLWSHYAWGINVVKYIKRIKKKPDMIYSSLPTFSAARLVGKWCNNNGIRFIVDVQDIWPEAFKVAIKNPILQKAFLPMEWVADAAYKAADYVIACSDTYRDRGLRVNRRSLGGLTVYLGNDGEKFDSSRESFRINKPSDEFWLAYIGTMGYSYDLKLAIDAIKIVNQRNLAKKVKFIGMGDGPLLNEYMQYAKDVKVNAEFTGTLPYEEMVGKMCSCDAVINCLRQGAAQSITNKVGDYALSGLPVINTQENLEYRKLVQDWHCGINCECGNVQEVVNAIVKLLDNPALCTEMGKNARKLGEEHFDRRKSYIKIIEVLENLN